MTPVIRRILVGVDGSTNSLTALGWAAAVAQATGAEVIALHALGLLAHFETGSAPTPVEHHRDEIAARLDREWCKPLRDACVQFRSVMRYGPPAGVLLEEADSLDVDLVVVGSRGHTGPTATLLGSTSTQVANQCSKPVLIVPLAKPGK